MTDITSSDRFQSRACWWGSKLGGVLTGPLYDPCCRGKLEKQGLTWVSVAQSWVLLVKWPENAESCSVCSVPAWTLSVKNNRTARQGVGPSSGPSSMGSFLSSTQKDGIWLKSIGFSLDPYWWKKKDQQQWVLECFVNSSWPLLLSLWDLGRPVLILVTCSLSWQSRSSGIADSREEKSRKTGGG